MTRPTTGETPEDTAPTAAERQRVAAILRGAVGAGILSLDEFEARLGSVYSARSVRQLEELVRWLPAPPSRQESDWRLLTVSAVVAVIVIALVVALAKGHARSTAAPAAAPVRTGSPVVTNVVQIGPDTEGLFHATVYVHWPPRTIIGCIESPPFPGGPLWCGKPAASKLDLSASPDPVSFRAIACWTKVCRVTVPLAAGMATSGWYQPPFAPRSLDFAVAPPEVDWDSGAQKYRVSVFLADEPNAPAYIVYRDGTPEDSLFVSLQQDFCDVSVLCVVDDVAPSPDQQNVSYTVAACFSDCDPLNAKTFARVTFPSYPVIVPVRSS